MFRGAVSNSGPTVIQGVLLPPVRLMSSDMIENFIATEDYAVIAQRNILRMLRTIKTKTKTSGVCQENLERKLLRCCSQNSHQDSQPGCSLAKD